MFNICLILASALLVYGGFVDGDSATSDAEVIDLSGKKLLCSKPPNHPKNLQGMFGAFYYGEVIICGGGHGQMLIKHSDECYTYTNKARYVSVFEF